MQPIVTNVTWSVGLTVMIVSLAKTAETIGMPFGYGFRWAQGTMY